MLVATRIAQSAGQVTLLMFFLHFFFVLFVAFVVKLFGCGYAAIGYDMWPLRDQ
jgi:hypothetical protein